MGKLEIKITDKLHRDIKAMSATKGIFLKNYIIHCFEEQIWRDKHEKR